MRAFVRKLLPSWFLLRYVGFVSVGDRVRVTAFHVCLDVVGSPDIRHNLSNEESLPLRSASIRSIYSAHCLEHIPDPAAEIFLKEAFRVLRPGGELLIDVPDPDRAFSMLHLALTDPEHIFFQRYIRDMRITRSKIDQRVATHFDGNSPSEWALDPLNVITFAIFANYLNPPFASEHLPVLHDPEIIAQRVRTMSTEQFAKWAVDSLPNELRYSGGHCNFWTAAKMTKFAIDAGFDIASRVHGESRRRSSLLVPDSAFERRDIWSAKYSLIKPRTLI